MKYIFILSLLVSCNRSPSVVGSKVIVYNWKCVKSQINTGMTFNGDFVVTSSCSVNKCFKREIIIGEYPWNDKIINEELVSDDICIYRSR